VNLFTYEGHPKGVLTRGRENDQLFKPRWTNPIDMHSRDFARRKEALKLIKKLNLQRVTNKMQSFHDPFSDGTGNQKKAHDDRTAAHRDLVSLNTSLKSKLLMVDLQHQHEINVHIEVKFVAICCVALFVFVGLNAMMTLNSDTHQLFDDANCFTVIVAFYQTLHYYYYFFLLPGIQKVPRDPHGSQQPTPVHPRARGAAVRGSSATQE
jgi:hypothetical protein